MAYKYIYLKSPDFQYIKIVDLMATEDKLTLILKDVTYWQFNAGEWNDAHEKYNFGFVCQYSASKTGIGIYLNVNK